MWLPRSAWSAGARPDFVCRHFPPTADYPCAHRRTCAGGRRNTFAAFVGIVCGCIPPPICLLLIRCRRYPLGADSRCRRLIVRCARRAFGVSLDTFSCPRSLFAPVLSKCSVPDSFGHFNLLCVVVIRFFFTTIEFGADARVSPPVPLEL